MRFIRAGVTSNEAPAAETTKPPVHFYQAYYAHYIHTSGQRVHVQDPSPHARKQNETDVFVHSSFAGLTVKRRLITLRYTVDGICKLSWIYVTNGKKLSQKNLIRY